MFATLTCIAQHDLRLVALAALICVMAVAAGLSAYRRAQATQGLHRLIWIAIAATVIGSGVWCTHFVAMLAYQQDLRLAFGVVRTVASLLAVIGGMGCGVAAAATSRDGRGRALGGAVCGAAVAVMHFVGVSAMQLPASLVWDPALVVQAIAISLIGGAAAFAVIGDRVRPTRFIAGIGLMVVAICGLHFTAMAAVTLVPAARVVDAGLYGRAELAIAVAGLAGLLVLSATGLLLVDRISAGATFAGVKSALNYAPSAMAFFDGDGRMVFCNAQYASVLEAYGLSAAPGLSFRAIVAAADQYGLPAGLNTAHSFSDFEGGEFRLGDFSAPDGRWFHPRMAPTDDGGLVVLLTDVSEHRAMARREADAREAAEAANRAKGAFLANISHEIRTPLNAVLGMAQIMRREAGDGRHREQLDVIISAGEGLAALLNGVLDWTTIDAGEQTLDLQPLVLEAMVRQTAAAYAGLAADHGVAFAVDIDPDAAGTWLADGVKLRQALSALLSNACKFTELGSIRLAVAAADEGLVFTIADTGIGIAADQRDHIFEMFTQADDSSTRSFGGAGMGLALCQSLVRLMGGRLSVDSTPGVGSRFSILLPLKRAADQPAAAQTMDGPIADEALRILIAEDNAANQLIIKGLLEPFGATLSLVDNGEAAVAVFGQAAFDLVLMDIQMPRMDGIEAARRIRALEREAGSQPTPILALTANVMSGQIAAYRQAGMDGFVAKPIEAGALFAAIDGALHGGEVDGVGDAVRAA